MTNEMTPADIRACCGNGNDMLGGSSSSSSLVGAETASALVTRAACLVQHRQT